MDLDQLRAFVAVVEAGGFTRAAETGGSTQPTLSRQVAALERTLGKPLLDRLGRRVEPTAFGREILPRARDLLAAARALVSHGREEPVTLSGDLRLGVADSVILSRFPPLLARFQRRHPDVTVHIECSTSPHILAAVRRGRLDAGLCMLPAAHPGLVLHPLWEDGFLAVVQPCHALAGRTSDLAGFAACRQVVISPGTLSYQVLTAVFREAGLSLVPDMDFDNFHLLCEFVAAGVGVGISSSSVARDFVEQGRLAPTPIAELDGLVRRLGVVHSAGRATTPELQALLVVLEAANAPGGGRIAEDGDGR